MSSNGVFLREIFLAELTESMADGYVPFTLRLLTPLLLILHFHRQPRLFTHLFTPTRLLAAFGLLVIFSGQITADGDILLRTNATTHNLQTSPTINSDPSVQALSGWRGWNTLLEMPLWKQYTFAPAARQLLFVTGLLSAAASVAQFLGGPVIEAIWGMQSRMTQCSGNFGGERVFFLGIVLRTFSCCVLGYSLQYLLTPSSSSSIFRTALSMLVPEQTTFHTNEGELVIRDQLRAVVSLLCTMVVALAPIAPFLSSSSGSTSSTSPAFCCSCISTLCACTSSSSSFAATSVVHRILTDDDDFEIPSSLAKRIDDDPTAGERFWQNYFRSRAQEREKFVRNNDQLESKQEKDLMLEDLWMDEIDMPLLYSDPHDIHTATDIESVVESLHATFLAGWSRPVHQRKRVLVALRALVTENKDAIVAAGKIDLHRPTSETFFWEYTLLLSRIDHILTHLDDWTSNTSFDSRRSRTATWPSTQRLRPEPLGVVAVFGGWNFPFLSSLSSVAGALAAGNTVVLQPSFVGKQGASSALLTKLIPKYLDRAMISVVGAGFPRTKEKECMEAVLKCKCLGKVSVGESGLWFFISYYYVLLCTNILFYLFFTATVSFSFPSLFQVVYAGGDDITLASLIAEMAGKQRIPCDTHHLAMGGRNPVYVDQSVTDLSGAAKRIVWAKMCNAGQHPDAPGYVLCHHNIVEEFLTLCDEWVVWFYGINPRQSNDFGRIVDAERMQSLVSTLQDTMTYANAFDGEDANATMHEWEADNVRADWSSGHCVVVVGGEHEVEGLKLENTDVEKRYIGPTVVFVSRDVPLMERTETEYTDDILDDLLLPQLPLGPILPVVAVKDMNDAIEEINGRPVPSSLYLFADDANVTRAVVAQTRAGGVTINSCLWHGVHADLKDTFGTFSHWKPILEKETPWCCVPCSEAWWVYPRYQRWKERLGRCVMRYNHW